MPTCGRFQPMNRIAVAMRNLLEESRGGYASNEGDQEARTRLQRKKNPSKGRFFSFFFDRELEAGYRLTTGQVGSFRQSRSSMSFASQGQYVPIPNPSQFLS